MQYSEKTLKYINDYLIIEKRLKEINMRICELADDSMINTEYREYQDLIQERERFLEKIESVFPLILISVIEDIENETL